MKKFAVMLAVLAIAMCSSFSVLSVSAQGAELQTATGQALTWDDNGVSAEIPYLDGKAAGEFPEEPSYKNHYGMFAPDQGNYAFMPDGSLFVVPAGNYIMLGGTDINVDRVINLTFTMDPQEVWGQNNGLGRFSFAFFNDIATLFTAGPNSWNPSYGAKTVVWGGMNENYGDAADPNYHRLSINYVVSQEYNYDGGEATLSIVLKENGAESKAYFNGVEFANGFAAKGDFADGFYISMMALEAPLQVKMKVHQTDDVPVTTLPVDVELTNKDGNPLTWDSNGITTEHPYIDGRPAAGAFDTNYYGIYEPGQTYSYADDGSTFLLTGGSFMLIGGTELDIEKEITFTFTMDPNDAWSNHDQLLGRFYMAFFDDLNKLFTAGYDAWKPEYDAKTSVWGALTPTDHNYQKLSISNADWLQSEAYDYNGHEARFTLVLGETTEETKAYFNGVQFAQGFTSRDAFKNGFYVSLIALEQNLEVKMKVTNGHTLNFVEGSATCTKDGTMDHYECEICHKLFKDAAGEIEIQEDELNITAPGHNFTEVPATRPTCTEPGNKAHYRCENCGMCVEHEGDETEMTDIEIPATGHDLFRQPRIEPTTQAEGTIEHWLCLNCGKKFLDAEGEVETENVSIPKLPEEEIEDDGCFAGVGSAGLMSGVLALAFAAGVLKKKRD